MPFQGSPLYDYVLLGIGDPSLSLSLQFGGGKNCITASPRTAPAFVDPSTLLAYSAVVPLLNHPLMIRIRMHWLFAPGMPTDTLFMVL